MSLSGDGVVVRGRCRVVVVGVVTVFVSVGGVGDGVGDGVRDGVALLVLYIVVVVGVVVVVVELNIDRPCCARLFS